MNLFSFSAAQYFCKSFAGSPGISMHGTDNFVNTFPKTLKVVTESTSEYSELRDALLRDTDRRLFLSLGAYRRAIQSTNSGSAYWSCVSLYYTSYFCAQAILGMFGCWVSGFGRPWIESVGNTPGTLALQVTFSRYPSKLNGSHKLFWDAYYKGIPPLIPFIDQKYSNALQPINSQVTWAIDTRNKINYQPIEAMSLRELFDCQYDPANIPSCFPADLGTLCTVAEAFLGLSRELACSLGLATDSFSGFAATRKAATLACVINEARPEIDAIFAPNIAGYAI